MSAATPEHKKVTVKTLSDLKKKGEKISMLTAYDFTMAKIVDHARVDVILVGDSASNVMAGHETTLPITLDQMIYHASAVVRAVERALVVVDLPFGYYQSDPKEALKSAIRIMKESGAHAVKLEGGKEIKESIKRILHAGIPVMGHLGLTPQSVNAFGGYKVQGRGEKADQILEDAKVLEKAGAFSIVLEAIPADLAKEITNSTSIPTIGIGAGPDTDGQVMVWQDLVGLTPDPKPKFVKRYLNLREEISKVVKEFSQDVESGKYPDANHLYK